MNPHMKRKNIAVFVSKHMTGATLIELIMMIIITSILATGLLSVFNATLVGTTQGGQTSQATLLAVERMELILPQRQQLGFAGFTSSTFDPCTSSPASTQAACTSLPSGYTVTSSLQNDWLGDSNYKVITVSISGTEATSLQALVANY